jgi:hypothetical protein
MQHDWPFDQPRNSAAVTVRQILDGTKPILLVIHDAYDNGWQFLTGGPFIKEDGKLVCLEHIVAQDPTLIELADLPPGYWAERESVSKPWQKIPPPEES